MILELVAVMVHLTLTKHGGGPGEGGGVYAGIDMVNHFGIGGDDGARNTKK